MIETQLPRAEKFRLNATNTGNWQNDRRARKTDFA